MEKDNAFLIDQGVWSDYPQLEKQGYVKVFTVVGDNLPQKMEKVVSIPYKTGFVINENVSLASESYHERAIWVPRQKATKFYKTDFYKLVEIQHPESSVYITRGLQILTNFGVKWEPLEAIYEHRFYKIQLKEEKLNLMFNKQFKSLTIWNQEKKDQLDDVKIELDDSWEKRLKTVIENLLAGK